MVALKLGEAIFILIFFHQLYLYSLSQVEPFFVTLALYDASAGKKISADLHLDLNHPLVSPLTSCIYKRLLNLSILLHYSLSFNVLNEEVHSITS